MRIAFFCVAALLLSLAAQKGVSGTLDNDFFWHLRVGQQLQRDGVRPLVDDISFASRKDAWTPYSWLAELAMIRLWDAGGIRSAVVAQATLNALLVLAMLWCAVESTGVRPAGDGFVSSLIATAITAFIALRYVSLRPVGMAFMLIAACVALLMRDRRLDARSRSIWFVPLLLAVGVNIHFFVLMVPLWILCLLIGDRRSLDHRSFRRALVLLLASVLACCATPMLAGTVRSIAQYSLADPMVSAGMMTELQPFYSGAAGWLAAALAAVALRPIIARRRCITRGEWACLATATVLLLRYGRFSPLFAIVACPLSARSLRPIGDRALRVAILPLACVCASVLTLYRTVAALPARHSDPSVWLNRPQVGRFGYPESAVHHLLHDVPYRSGNVINSLEWGGYLSFRLGPRYRVMVDGRTQLYTPEFWRSTYLGTDDDTRRYFATLDADAAVLKLPAARFHRVLISRGWRIAYQDPLSEVLIPPVASAKQHLTPIFWY